MVSGKTIQMLHVFSLTEKNQEPYVIKNIMWFDNNTIQLITILN